MQKGGRYHVPKPMVHTYPHGVGTARGAAIHRQHQNASMLTSVNNHTHGNGEGILEELFSFSQTQRGGGDCTGGAVPIAPTYGVPQGPGHMNPGNQSIGNYNSSCQAQANRVFDSLVPKPPPMPKTQDGGKRRKRKTRSNKKKTHRRRTNRRRTNRRRR